MSEDQAENLRQNARVKLQSGPRAAGAHHCRVLTVTGGKGGVGKTNVAVNLALALCQAGARVLLLDADFGLANVDLLLGLAPKLTLTNVIRREAQLSDIVVDVWPGLHLLPGGSGLPEMANLSTLEMVRLSGGLRALEHEHDWLVIDTPAGIGRSVMHFCLAADELLLVSTPEPTAMLDAYGLLKALRGQEVRGRLHLLFNMVRQRADAAEAQRALSSIAKSYLGLTLHALGSLPQDEAVAECVRQHEPFMLAKPRAPAAVALREAAAYFIAQLALPPSGSREGFFARWLGSVR